MFLRHGRRILVFAQIAGVPVIEQDFVASNFIDATVKRDLGRSQTEIVNGACLLV
jgi:hypothetical protein